MARLTIWERVRVARLAAERTRVGMLAGMLGSPLLRWRYGAPIAEELLLIPRELRAADPSFVDEIAQGEFGLAGWVAHLENKGSPFKLVAPSEAWARELHGFAWLRHLRAAGTQQAQELALALVGEWITAGRAHPAVAWEPAVVGRRIVSWIGNAGLLLDDVEPARFDRTAQSLADQLISLSSAWRCAADGHPRLIALIGLVYGDLCIAGHDRHLAQAEAMLGAELQRQVLPDGGHVSRNTGVLVELMLDLLPLRQCYATRKRAFPPAIEQAMARMLPMLRYMRLGDGSLARFNGMGTTPIAELATIIAYDSQQQPQRRSEARHARYVRLERRDLVVIADVGAPPPLELAGQAHAGCLSFELSAGQRAIVVNGGAPGSADRDMVAVARGTASHNTLSLGGKSSSRLLQHARLERLAGGAPVRFPDNIRHVREPGEAAHAFEASHDGYVNDFRLVHRRRLVLSADKAALEGTDWLAGPRGPVRLVRDAPFAIHFHLHPHVRCKTEANGTSITSVELRLRDGMRW